MNRLLGGHGSRGPVARRRPRMATTPRTGDSAVRLHLTARVAQPRPLVYAASAALIAANALGRIGHDARPRRSASTRNGDPPRRPTSRGSGVAPVLASFLHSLSAAPRHGGSRVTASLGSSTRLHGTATYTTSRPVWHPHSSTAAPHTRIEAGPMGDA
jgi:hypothetical protein